MNSHRFVLKKKRTGLNTCYVPLAALLFPFSGDVCSRDYFNAALLETTTSSPAAVDLSNFEAGGQAPGKYQVDVVINNKTVDTLELTFVEDEMHPKDGTLAPCFNLELLQMWGIKVTDYYANSTKDDACLKITSIPNASAEFKFNTQRLELSIPQTALSSQARDYISPEKWDEGITAFLLNYSLDGFTSIPRHAAQPTTSEQYGNFRPGLNLGAWRFRNYSTWSTPEGSGSKWDSVYNYVERDITFLRSRLTAGDTNASGDVFDSVSFRGIQLASEDEMTPDSQKGYAPIVRGIARTYAQVVVTQNGHTIYSTSVAPGAFEINDLYPTGASGDMNVTVKESDGSEQHQVVPYASLPLLQREGHLKYSVAAGKTHFSGSQNANVAQLVMLYGLPHGVTPYAGVQQTTADYSALAVGLGVNMGDIGAVSGDVTQSSADVVQKDAQNISRAVHSDGRSFRLRYSKDIAATGTNMSIAGYRYSTAGYYSLADALATREQDNSDNAQRKDRTELSLSQDIVYGAIAVSFVRDNYWDHSRSSSVSIAYNNSWRNINYSINYVESSNNDDRRIGNSDRQIFVNIRIPFDRYISGASVNSSMSYNKQGNANYNIGASGTLLDDKNLSWNIQQGYSNTNNNVNGSLSADYKSRYSEVNGGYAYDANSDRFNYGIQGGLLVHSGGMTLSQPFSDTIVLVNTNGAEEVSVSNQTNIKTDAEGFAVVPYASPYHKNIISLDTENLQSNTIELEETSKEIVPTHGAVTVAKYQTSMGFRALFNLELTTGGPVPFGATATVLNNKENAQHSSIVGESGQVYVSGLDEKGSLFIKWADDDSSQCRVNYILPKNKNPSGVQILSGVCR